MLVNEPCANIVRIETVSVRHQAKQTINTISKHRIESITTAEMLLVVLVEHFHDALLYTY